MFHHQSTLVNSYAGKVRVGARLSQPFGIPVFAFHVAFHVVVEAFVPFSSESTPIDANGTPFGSFHEFAEALRQGIQIFGQEIAAHGVAELRVLAQQTD